MSKFMEVSFALIETTLKKNVEDVKQLAEFDNVILDFSITAIRELQDKLSKIGIDNPHLMASNTLTMLENVRSNESLRPKYETIFNQCVVLLVSVFASSVAELFRSAIDKLIDTGQSNELEGEEFKLSVRELEDFDYRLDGRIGQLVAEKNDISFQDMKSINRAFKKYFSISVEKDAITNNIIMAQAARNVIVHDAATCNDRLRKQVSGATPRDIKPDLSDIQRIQFDPDEIQLVGNSMLEYFSQLRKRVEESASSKTNYAPKSALSAEI